MANETLDQSKKSSNLKVVAGTHTTVAASDAVSLASAGIKRIVSATVSLNSDPSDDPEHVSCTFSGATLTIKTWKNGATDPTPAAATTFTKVVNYIVVGD